MSSKKTFILIAFAAVIIMAYAFQNSSEHKVLFEKAKFTMETKGDLKGAINLFEQIIKKYPDEREYAAKSQLYIGLCYEKLGLREAQKAFQKVIDNYPGQTETVKVAKEKLAVLLKAQAVVEKGDKEFKIRKVLEFPTGGTPSLDGHYATYVDWDTGDVVLRELDTGKTRRLTNEGTWKKPMQFALYSVISPDNKLIAYCWYNLHETYDLRLIGIDGSNRRILYSDKDYEVYPASWSYDGKHIAVMNYNKENGGFKIALVAVADGSLRVLNTKEKLVFPRLCYSPDNRYIVYDYPVDKDSGNRDLSLFAVDGSSETPLVKHPADDKLLGWAPMRKEILFLSDRSGTKDIWIIQVADGKPQGSPKPVKRNIGEISPPLAYTQDGSFYFGIFTRWFTTQVAPFDLATGKIQEQSAQAILGSTSFPAWSPKGGCLAFITEQKESRDVGYLIDLSTFDT